MESLGGIKFQTEDATKKQRNLLCANDIKRDVEWSSMKLLFVRIKCIIYIERRIFITRIITHQIVNFEYFPSNLIIKLFFMHSVNTENTLYIFSNLRN